jgi:ABC-type lipoprotein release transport system permease subunit
MKQKPSVSDVSRSMQQRPLEFGLATGTRLSFMRPVSDASERLKLEPFTLDIVGTYSLRRQILDTPTVYVKGEKFKDNREIWLYLKEPESLKLPMELVAKIFADEKVLIESWSEKYQSNMKTLKIESIIMAVIIGLVVTAAAMAVFSGFIFLTKTKVTTIAILKTIGYRDVDVVGIFGMCAIMIWISSFILGGSLSFLFLNNIDFILSSSNKMHGISGSTYALPVEMKLGHFTWAMVISLISVVLAMVPSLVEVLRLSPSENFRRSS